MRIVDGYVCIAKAQLVEILFGKAVSVGQGLYEALETNGIVAFASCADAKEAFKHLSERTEFNQVTLGRIELKIAENESDLVILRDSNSLIVIMKSPDQMFFIGRREAFPGAYPLPGAYLRTNGMKPFENFVDAEYVALEVNRQAQCAALIAGFALFLERS